MNTKKTLIVAVIVGLLFLTGCVATPYYGSAGYYRGTAYGYGYQPSIYYSTQGYVNTPRHYIGGHIHHNGGHKHFIGSHRHSGGHKHFGGHRGGGHRGHRR